MSLTKNIDGSFNVAGVHGVYRLIAKMGNWVHIHFYSDADKNDSGIGYKKHEFVGNAIKGNFDPPKNNSEFENQIKQQISAHAKKLQNK